MEIIINQIPNKMTWKQHFIKFLKDNNAYEQFMFYFDSRRGKLFRERKNLLCSSESYFYVCYKKNYLIDAFLWIDTSQNYDYWESLSNKWIKLLENDVETTFHQIPEG